MEKITTLSDTIELMESDDYKDRFKAEYWQLKLRIESLDRMLRNYKHGDLHFKPTCAYEIFLEQRIYMHNYLCVLEARAHEDGILL